jgi:hypothetical protein
LLAYNLVTPRSRSLTVETVRAIASRNLPDVLSPVALFRNAPWSAKRSPWGKLACHVHRSPSSATRPTTTLPTSAVWVCNPCLSHELCGEVIVASLRGSCRACCTGPAQSGAPSVGPPIEAVHVDSHSAVAGSQSAPSHGRYVAPRRHWSLLRTN